MRLYTSLQIVVTVFMFLLHTNAFAQSSGDKLFMEGQKLQQIQTIAAQNQAIKKFKSAKVVYTTKEKKKMCDNQITICNNNIASIRRGGKKQTEEESQKTIAVKLSIKQKQITFDAEKTEEVEVPIIAASKSWEFQPMDGNLQFVNAMRGNDSTTIRLKVKDNELTLERREALIITHGEEKDTLVVTQKGKPVTLSLSSNLMEYRLKGGNKSLEIYTNSDSIVTSNENQAWYVESKPDWIEVNIDYDTSKRNLLSAIKGVPSNQAAKLEGVKTTRLKILAVPLMKSDPEYQSGRKGEIVFASQNKRYKVIVVQQK